MSTTLLLRMKVCISWCTGLYSKECNHWSFFSLRCNATSCFREKENVASV